MIEAEYRQLCNELETIYNPDLLLLGVPDNIINLKARLIREFRDYKLKVKSPAMPSLYIIKNNHFISIDFERVNYTRVLIYCDVGATLINTDVENIFNILNYLRGVINA